jgi:arylsulfatase A
VVEFPADQATLTERYTRAAVDFVTRNRERPFLLYLPHSMPHLPLAVSENFRGKSAGGTYGDVIECIDWSTGRIVDTLKKLGLAEDTVVVFTSDNGPWTQRRRGKNVGFAKPLRAGKATTYEGGMREPCVMWAPGRIPPGLTCDEVATVMDLYPTFAAMAGVELPEGRIIDGRDIRPLMAGREGARSPHEAFFYYSSGGKLEGVRRGRWKLLVRKQTELFDLAADIGESNNLAEKHPELVKELRQLMSQFDRDLSKKVRPAGRLGKK